VNILHMDTELSVLKCLGVKKLLLTWKVYKDDPSLFKQIRAMHNTIGGFGGPKNASKPSLGSNKGSRTGSLDWLGLRMEHYMALHSNLSGHVKQEWNVIKVNQRGKEQERCIGVDMQYIYNRKRKDVSVSSWLDFGGVRRKQRPVKNIKRVGFGRYSGGRKDSGERIALDIVSLDMVNSRSEASRPLRAFYIRYHDGYVHIIFSLSLSLTHTHTHTHISKHVSIDTYNTTLKHLMRLLRFLPRFSGYGKIEVRIELRRQGLPPQDRFYFTNRVTKGVCPIRIWVHPDANKLLFNTIYKNTDTLLLNVSSAIETHNDASAFGPSFLNISNTLFRVKFNCFARTFFLSFVVVLLMIFPIRFRRVLSVV